MAYSADSFTAFEQPTAAKWNKLWSNDASFNDGTGLPSGTLVQMVDSQTSAFSTGSTAIPVDDTIPQSSEGDQYLSATITPRNANNKLIIEVTLFCALDGAGDIVAALFQDAGANALTVESAYHATANQRRFIKLYYEMVAGTTSATTFKVRAGPSPSGTVTVNGSSGARLFGAINKSSIVIKEHTV